jgi:protein TonB
VVTVFLSKRLAASARWWSNVASTCPPRVVHSYAISVLAHVVVLGGLAVWSPSDEAPGFSAARGDGGFGSEYAPLGSAGGAPTTSVFHVEFPPVVASEESAPAQAITFAPDVQAVEPVPEAKATIAVSRPAQPSPPEAPPVETLQIASVEITAPDPEATPLEIQRPLATSEPRSQPSENLAEQMSARKVASAPSPAEVRVELPAVQEANGRGQEGAGSGLTQGGGNGGTFGRAGGDFDFLARVGPLNPTPPYPYEARIAGMEGIVYIRVRIAADGTVKSARIDTSSGWTILDESALTTIQYWRFEPARRSGFAVECELRIPFDFHMRRR